MIVLLVASISCTQAVGLLQRISNISELTETQKTEIITEIHKTIPSCPVILNKDAK